MNPSSDSFSRSILRQKFLTNRNNLLKKKNRRNLKNMGFLKNINSINLYQENQIDHSISSNPNLEGLSTVSTSKYQLVVKGKKIKNTFLNCLLKFKFIGEDKIYVRRLVIRILKEPTDMPNIDNIPNFFIYNDSYKKNIFFPISPSMAFGSNIHLKFQDEKHAVEITNLDEQTTSFEIIIKKNQNLKFLKFEMVNSIYAYILFDYQGHDTSISQVIHFYKCTITHGVSSQGCQRQISKTVEISTRQQLLSIKKCQGIEEFSKIYPRNTKLELIQPYIFIQEEEDVRVISYNGIEASQRDMIFPLGNNFLKLECQIQNSTQFNLILMYQDSQIDNSIVFYMRNSVTSRYYKKNINIQDFHYLNFEWIKTIDIIKCECDNQNLCIIIQTSNGIQIIEIHAHFRLIKDDIYFYYSDSIDCQQIFSWADENQDIPITPNNIYPTFNREGAKFDSKYLKFCQK